MVLLWRTSMVLVLFSSLSHAFWVPGTEVVYKYQAQLDASTRFPIQAVSQWFMKGSLVVQGDNDIVTIQLQNVTLSAYNGPLHRDVPTEESPPPEEAIQLLQPFILHFQNRQLVDLSVKAGEDVWSINMKRGLAGLLQLDPSALHSPASVSNEKGLHGHCNVEYAVQNHTNGTISVSKSIDFTTCKNYPSQTLTNSHKVLCPIGPPQQSVDVVSVRTYHLKPLGPDGELIISNAIADGGMYFQPFKSQSEAYYIWTWMELQLETQDTTKIPIQVKGGGEKVGLKYELPGTDVSQGRNPPSQQELLSAVVRMLKELGESLKPPGLEMNLTKLHEERVAHVLYFLSLLNHSSVGQLYSELAVGTSYQHETLRNLFLELLPLVGSHDTVLLIRDLVLSGTLKNDTAVQLLTAFPFSIRKPSEQLLKDFEVVLTLPENSVLYSSAILTFATLVHIVCQNGCGHDTVDKYVGQYLDLFTTSDTYEKQMLYLEALGNFELERVALYLAPIISGTDTRYSHYIRYLAVWATFNLGVLHPTKVYNLYWPLLSNRDELLEMRVAALTMLIASQPTVARFYRLMSFMMEESDPHLRHFWYTTLHSLVETNYPCYLHMADVAKKAVRFFPEPDIHHWATGNYILDYTDLENGFGSLAHLFMIANPQTGLPSVFYLDFGSHAMDYSYNQYSLYVRLNGVGDLFKQRFVRDTVSVNKLLELLKQLKLPSKISEPVHVELFLKMQNKVVFVHHANQSTFSSLFEVLNNIQLIATGGVHVNAQNIVVPFFLEETRVTDIGTTALLRVSNSWLMSVRANFTAGKQLSSELDLRSYLSSQTALTQYNPVLDMWHGVQRSLNLQAVAPLNLQFSVENSKQNIKFSVQELPSEEIGVVGHVRTVVFVRGITAEAKLKTHCSTCSAQFVVIGNKDQPAMYELAHLGLSHERLQLALLGCEHSFHKDDLSSLLHDVREHQNFNIFPTVSPILTLLHLYDSAILVPPSGSCGLVARLSHLVTQPTQADVEIVVNRTLESRTSSSLEPIPAGEFNIQINLLTNFTPPSVINIYYKHSLALSQHWISSKLSFNDQHVASINLNATFPEPSPEVSFLSEMQPHFAVMDLSAEYGDSNLQIRMEADVTPEQQEHVTDPSTWPYNVCQNDLHDTEQWGERYAPLTQACFEMARELSTLRRYNFSISSSNLPKWPYLPSANNITMQLEVPQDTKASVNINGQKKVLSVTNSRKLEQWLINTQFPPILQFATYMGSVGSCVITSRSVWTLDGANLTVKSNPCYSLAVADCSNTPQFAVFMKKLDGAVYPLALKVYTGDNVIEILPAASNVSIFINDYVVESPQKGYQHPPGESRYHFKVWQRSDGLIRIHVASAHLWIEYYGHFATTTVLGVYHGKLCGLCGDHNGDASDDRVNLYSFPCLS